MPRIEFVTTESPCEFLKLNPDVGMAFWQGYPWIRRPLIWLLLQVTDGNLFRPEIDLLQWRVLVADRDEWAVIRSAYKHNHRGLLGFSPDRLHGLRPAPQDGPGNE